MWYKKMPLMVLCCFIGISQAQAIDLSDVPVDVQLNAAPPVLMLILDNSSDMLAEFLTEEPDGLFKQYRYLFSPDHGSSRSGQESVLPESERGLWKSQWHGYNSVFYSPGTDYPPWTETSNLVFGQADIHRPCYDPVQCSTDSRGLQLAQPFMHVYDGQRTYAVANAHYFTVYDTNHNGCYDRDDPVYLVTWSDENEDGLLDVSGNANADRRLYFRYIDDGDGLLEAHEVSLVTNPEEKNRIRPAVYNALGGFERYRTDLEDLQNFANWFSYYRSSALCLKAAVGSALASADRVGVGIYAVNEEPRTAATGQEDSSAYGNGSLRDKVYHMKFSDGSSLRSALDAVGRYYHQTIPSSLGPSPYAGEDRGGGCQSAHALILTGGRGYGSFSGIGNADGDKGSPYADAWPDTLADVAMHYYETDLAPQLIDAYTGHGCDTALHQHLITHAISFGPSGTIDTGDIDGDGNIDSPSYLQDPCLSSPGIPKPVWPQPLSGTPSLVDDVWHAAVNGRGFYYHTKNSTDLVRRLEEMITRIQASAQVRAATFASGFAEDSSMLVKSSYSSGDWSGDLQAYRFDPAQEASGAVTGDMLWQASTNLAAAMGASNTRRIVSYGGFWRDAQGIPFQYDSLSDAQRAALGSDLVIDSVLDRSARDRLGYLRGADSPQFRPRVHLLGDVVHAAPLIAGRTVFCGANDGMMHAFALDDGTERFAYVPHLVFDHLVALSRYDYPENHRFYVDGPIYAGEVMVGAYQRSTFLVGGLGRGGKGYYCLRLNQRNRPREGGDYGDYTTTFSIDDMSGGSSENEISSIVLWEYPRPRPDDDGMDNNGNGLTDEPGENDPDVGFSYPRAYVVNANTAGDDFSPVVIFGNGYGSESRKAVLYILDAEKGTLLRKIDTGADDENGLSSPALVDVDMDRRVDYAYAGDLRGNLWKFDLTAEDPHHWGLAYGSDLSGDGVIDAAAGDLTLPVFRARGRSITTRPNVMRMHAQCGPQLPGFMVLFGTGRYLGASDRFQDHTDAFFGVWDYGDDGDDSEVLGDLPVDSEGRLSSGLMLARQQILGQTDQGGETYRSLSDYQPEYTVVEDSLDGDGYSRNNRGSSQDGDPSGVAGWYLELSADIQDGGMAAERIIQDLELRHGMIIAASFVPEAEACSSGGYSWLYLLGGCSGIPPEDQEGEAILPWRHPTAVSGNLIIRKSDPVSSKDILIFTDQQGKLFEKEFPGEKWGNRFWRENMIN